MIPKLGAFLVKQTDHAVVFSEFMKQDDGVLHALLCREEGLSDLEAAAQIDRFVFSVRHNIKHGNNFPVGGIGVLTLGPNNTIAFHHDPDTAPLPEEQRMAAPRPAMQPGLHAADLANRPAPHPEADDMAKATPDDTSATEAPAPRTAEEEILKEDIRRIYESQQAAASGNGEDSEPDKAPTPLVSASPKMKPASYVRGLQYRRPHKTTDAYEYNRPSEGHRPDKFLLMAIVAILLAVAAILFGHYVSTMNEDDSEPLSRMEQTRPADPYNTPAPRFRA